MIKTLIYYPEEIDRQIERLVHDTKKSKDKIIREALEEGLTLIQKPKQGGAEALLKVAELGKKVNAKGPKDLSTNLDKYLWES